VKPRSERASSILIFILLPRHLKTLRYLLFGATFLVAACAAFAGSPRETVAKAITDARTEFAAAKGIKAA